MTFNRSAWLGIVLAAGCFLLPPILSTDPSASAAGMDDGPPAAEKGDPSEPVDAIQTRTPIQHFIFLMQENHTFDNYFGTYPGADGIPIDTRMPVDPSDLTKGYVTPFAIGDSPIQDLSHSASTFNDQWNGGKMDGFVYALNQRNQNGRLAMGYYTEKELSYYYDIARNYVLFDRFFSSARNGSFQNHMYWIAAAPPVKDFRDSSGAYNQMPTIFDRLEEKGISWKFYIQNYDPKITYRTPGLGGNRASQVIWAPVLDIDRFIDDPELNSKLVDLDQYYTDLHEGTLPAAAFIAPSGASEHPPGSLESGQRFVRTLLQELMRSRYWSSSAFLWAYDDWGGWYDHVTPPQVDEDGYGLRVPALMVSAYARKGYVSHTVCDFTCGAKFIEYNWGLNPLAARDSQANVFLDAFNFQSAPRPPVVLPDTRSASLSTPAGAARPIFMVYWVAIGAAGVSILAAFAVSWIFKKRSKT